MWSTKVHLYFESSFLSIASAMKQRNEEQRIYVSTIYIFMYIFMSLARLLSQIFMRVSFSQRLLSALKLGIVGAS